MIARPRPRLRRSCARSTWTRRCRSTWLESNEPSYILYTSGTTGKPKGVQRDTGGYAVALAASMKHIFCCEAGRGVLLDLGHRLGGGPFVHRLRAAHQRLDHDHVRGRADAPRRGHLVEDRAGLEGDLDVHLAHRDPRAEEAGPEVHERARHRARSSTCSSRASRSTSPPRAGCPTTSARRHRRQLLADRDRLADPHRVPGRRGHAAQVRLAVVRRVRLPREAQARGDRQGGRRQREGRAVHRAAAAAGRR